MVADEPVALLEVLREQRGHADAHPALKSRAFVFERGSAGGQHQTEPADDRDDAGLLVEEPAIGVRAGLLVVGEQIGPLGQVEQDRVRLDEVAVVVDLQNGRRPRRVLAREVVRERVSAEDVDRHPLILEAELGHREPDLVAVGRGRIVVEAHHESPSVARIARSPKSWSL